jgi:hypothetical protein
MYEVICIKLNVVGKKNEEATVGCGNGGVEPQ